MWHLVRERYPGLVSRSGGQMLMVSRDGRRAFQLLPAHPTCGPFLPMRAFMAAFLDALYAQRAVGCHWKRLGGEGPCSAPEADRAGLLRDSFFHFQGIRFHVMSMLRSLAFSAARRKTPIDLALGT